MKFFKKFDDFRPINEDVQKAKKYLAEKHPSGDGILKQYTEFCSSKNCLGYVYMLIYFYYEFKFMFDDAKKLVDRLEFFKRNNLIQKLPKSPVDYILDGPEKLEDAMNQVERDNKANKIFNELPSNLKNIVDNQTQENKNKFKEAAILFYDLPDKSDLIKKLSVFKDFQSLLSSLISFVSKRSFSANYETLLTNLKSDTDVDIVYTDINKGVIVCRILTFDASKKFGSDAWCISRSISYFQQYTKNILAAQYFSWWFEKDITDKLFLVGFTVEQDGKMNFAHKKDDTPLVGINKTKYLEQTGIPTSVIKVLDSEQAINKSKALKFANKLELVNYLLSSKNNNIFLLYISKLSIDQQMDLLCEAPGKIFRDKQSELFLNNLDRIDVAKYLPNVITYFLQNKSLFDQFVDIVKKYVKNENYILQIINVYRNYYYTIDKSYKIFLSELIEDTIKDPVNKFDAYYKLGDMTNCYKVWKETGVIGYDKWSQLGSWMVKNNKIDDVKKLLLTEEKPNKYRAYRLDFYIKNKMNKEFFDEYSKADWSKDGMRHSDSLSERNFNESLFIEAVNSNNLELVKFFAEEKKVSIIRQFSNNHELVRCCREGYYEMFKYLLSTLKMDPNNGDSYWLKNRTSEEKKVDSHYGEYVLNCISSYYESDKVKIENIFKILKWLIEEKNADITFRNNELLREAIEKQNLKTTKYLISKGCKVDKAIMDNHRYSKLKSWIKRDLIKAEDIFTNV
jgi:hypothetical protein